MSSTAYNTDSIKILKGLEAVRKRHVSVVIHPDNSVTVEDNRRGIPVGMHKVHKRETL